MLETFLTQLQGPILSLWGPFAIIVICGLGIPIPEDVVLVVAGALAAAEDRSWVGVSLLMYIAVIGGDSLIFFVGRHLGGRMLASPLGQRWFSETRRAQVQRFFRKHGAKSLFFARFLPGIRSLVFFSAGSIGVPYLHFLLLDGLAALLSVPVFVWLGHWLWLRFGNDLAHFNAAMESAHQWSVWLIVGAVMLVLLFAVVRHLRGQR
jgi:membrane protein DedA with SNARE-associated domain